MPKVIVVVGQAKSGKSTSIANFLMKAARVSPTRRDALVVVKINGTPVGVASAGDDAASIKSDLAFLRARKCAVYVCAARVGVSGKSKMLTQVETFAKSIGVKPIKISTTSPPTSRTNDLVARDILKAI